MATTDPTEFKLEISEPDASADDIDQMTRQFLDDLKKETEIESAQLARSGPAPAGTKIGDPVMTGTILMSVLPAVLPKVIDMAAAWIGRGSGRMVKFKGRVGKQQIEFEGPPDELKKLLDRLGKDKKK